MFRGKTYIAIIPARGGSKRLPNKNILPLAGKPLVAWTIEAALDSKYLDEIILSSDDEKILEIGKSYGITSIKRPHYLADDTAKTVDVILYHLELIEPEPDYTVLLQPTSPLRTSKHIDEAIEWLSEKNADAVISVSEIGFPIEWCNVLPEDKNLVNFIKDEHLNVRSQDLPKRYRINGAIYVVKTEKFMKHQTFFLKKNVYAYVMDRISSVDIDDQFDFLFAEFLITKRFF
ncbi:N-acylneuraminate cytidylyltransferase [Thermosulfidibacter takaii ABI70S6]|uniref:N-acylneuraminate cytidylyltransferase n=2 Tax=Thermosulfidibacter takaii TaxID=412593 RepID=A0A0S3QV96_THET7|nr:N-acylneuraminate cytidylyltransferase [Thermosulfidibacter takaii ABI70S6]